MDKDELKGKAKDVAGRVERQAGEWTVSEELRQRAPLNKSQAKYKMQSARPKTQ
jgi:hypothetical protein